jgi:glycosyltransferase involved in cell wall biosynthesis
MIHGRKVIVIMPAYQAESTVAKTVADIPQGIADEIILVDDASTDRTVEVAKSLGLSVIQHPRNMGYGANQKTCYRAALDHGADIIIMIHPDYQYDSHLSPHLIAFIADGYFDIMLGTRVRTRREVLEGGMPLYKYISNRFLTFTENLVLGQNISDFHTGYRAYSRKVLETIPWEWNSDDFVFDTQALVQAIHFGFRIAEIPVPVRYMPEASSINFVRSVKYGFQTLQVLAQYWLHSLNIKLYPIFTPKLQPPTAQG